MLVLFSALEICHLSSIYFCGILIRLKFKLFSHHVKFLMKTLFPSSTHSPSLNLDGWWCIIDTPMHVQPTYILLSTVIYFLFTSFFSNKAESSTKHYSISSTTPAQTIIIKLLKNFMKPDSKFTHSITTQSANLSHKILYKP